MSPLVLMAMDWVRSQIIEPPEASVVGDDRRAEAALVHRVLTGPDGPALLELLAKTTVLRPAINPSLHGSASHDYAQRRTGENNVFAALIHLHDTHLKLTEGTFHDRSDRADRPQPVFGWNAGNADADACRDAGGGFDPRGTVAFTG